MKTTKLYVGNIPFDTSEDDVHEFFRPYTLSHVKLVTDRETGRPRGFCFVELASEHAEDAVKLKNRLSMGGRSIIVNVAVEKPRESRREKTDFKDRGQHERRRSERDE